MFSTECCCMLPCECVCKPKILIVTAKPNLIWPSVGWKMKLHSWFIIIISAQSTAMMAVVCIQSTATGYIMHKFPSLNAMGSLHCKAWYQFTDMTWPTCQHHVGAGCHGTRMDCKHLFWTKRATNIFVPSILVNLIIMTNLKKERE